SFYRHLHQKIDEFIAAIQRYVAAKNYKVKVVNVGSIFWLAFTNQPTIRAASDIDHSTMELYKVFHRQLLNRGVYLGPSCYEVSFVTGAHNKTELEKAKRAIIESLEAEFKYNR